MIWGDVPQEFIDKAIVSSQTCVTAAGGHYEVEHSV